MRLLFDELYSPVPAQALRQRGYDALAAVELTDLRGQNDPIVFRWAQAQHRAIVTNNLGDYLRLHALFLEGRQRHWGIILTDDRPFPRHERAFGLLIRSLEALLRAHPPDNAFRDRLHWLQPARE